MKTNRSQIKSACSFAFALTMVSTLAACGGDGGSSNNSAVVPPDQTPPPPPVVQEEPVNFNEAVLILAVSSVVEGEIEDEPMELNDVLWDVDTEGEPMDMALQ